MPDAISRQHGNVEHPAPHAHRISRWALFGALLAAPIAWFVQLNILYGMAGQACFPRDAPRLVTPSGYGWLTTALLAINVVALILTGVGTFVSWRNWRRTQDEARGGHHKLLEAGEGRTRFLSAWGLWGGGWFLIAILFDTIAAVWVPDMRRLTVFMKLMSGRARGAAVLLMLTPALAGCDERASNYLAALGLVHPKSAIGDIDKGEKLIGVYGCGSCHEIPGVAGARGLVGPPLTRMGRRIFIAGVLRNTPENMVAWLRDPQKIVPGNAMPTMGLSEEQARDVAAYLDNLR